jgi:cytochrome c oxidase subunit 2
MNGTSLQLDLICYPGAQETGLTNSRIEARLTRSVCRAPLSLYFLIVFVLIGQGVSATEQIDPSLVPSIFTPESTPAHAISNLAGFVLVITGAIFVVVGGLLVYALVRFRRRANDDGMEPAQVYGSGPVEAAWTTVPFLIVLVLYPRHGASHSRSARTRASRLPPWMCQVIGHQWWWEIRYPKLGIVTANELHVPVSQGGDRLPTLSSICARQTSCTASGCHGWPARPTLSPTNQLDVDRAGAHRAVCSANAPNTAATQHAKMLLRVLC